MLHSFIKKCHNDTFFIAKLNKEAIGVLQRIFIILDISIESTILNIYTEHLQMFFLKFGAQPAV